MSDEPGRSQQRDGRDNETEGPETGASVCLDTEALALLGARKPSAPLAPECESALNLLNARAAAKSADADWRSAKWSAVSAAAAIFALLALGLGFYQFMLERKAWRIERSLEMVKRGVEEGSVSNASLLLSKTYSAFLEAGGPPDQSFYAFAIENEPDATLAFDVVILHWEQIAICVEKDVCDEETVRAFIPVGAAQMLKTTCPYILDIRNYDGSYAMRAEKFLGIDCGTSQAKSAATNLPSELGMPRSRRV